MLFMFIQVIGVYDYIVEIDLYRFSYVLSKDLVHKPLERRQCIVQPKGHYFKLILTVFGKEGYFWPILFSKLNLPVC